MTTWDLDEQMRRRTVRLAVREFAILATFLASLYGLTVMAYGWFGV